MSKCRGGRSDRVSRRGETLLSDRNRGDRPRAKSREEPPEEEKVYV